MAPDGGQNGDGAPPGLEVDQELAFQRREWKAQRAAWAATALILAGALAGVFGHGPLSSMERGDDGAGVRVRYDRFVRHQAPAEVRLSISAAGDSGGGGGEVTVWVSRAYLDAVRIKSIAPEPVRSWSGPSRGGFVFATPPDGGGVLEAVLHVDVEQMGRIGGEIGVEGRDGTVRFSQFAYP